MAHLMTAEPFSKSYPFVQLSPKVEEIRRKLIDFVNNDCIPAEHILEKQLGDAKKGSDERFKVWPPILEELKAKAKSLGLWNLFLGHEYGLPTPGLSNLEYAVLCEVLGRSQNVAPIVTNCNAPDTGNMELLAKYGNEKQKAKWLTPLLSGEIKSAFVMTEPDQASSDAVNISTRIEKDGKGNYVINGKKHWITNGNCPLTKLYILIGKTNPDDPSKHKQQSIILIPRDTPGITIVRNYTVFGDDDAPIGHCELKLENVTVPMENVVLGEGRGFEVMQGRMGPGRIHHCMRAIGQAERSLDRMILEATDVSKKPFGKTKGEHQSVLFEIATSRMEIEQARLLVLNAAAKIDSVGTKAALREIGMAKVVVPNVLGRVLDRTIQITGAIGLSDVKDLATMFANYRTLRFVDGPDAVHTEQVGKTEMRRADALRKLYLSYESKSKEINVRGKL